MKLALLCFLSAVTCVLAHDPGISNATVDLGSSPLSIRFTFASADLLVAGMAGTDEASLQAMAVKVCEWRTDHGPALMHVKSAREVDKTTVEFVLDVPRTAGEFRSLLLPDMPLGHRQLLVLRDQAGESYRIQMLNAQSHGEVVSQHDLDRAGPVAQAVAQASPKFNALPWLTAVGICILGAGARRLTKGARLRMAV